MENLMSRINVRTDMTMAVLLVSAGALLSCGTKTEKKSPDPSPRTYTQLQKAAWLAGTWENATPEGTLTESWSWQNDSVMSGASYFINGKDTFSSETIRLEQSGTEVYYIPTVKDQNAGKPVKFRLTSSTDKMLVFENPEHDFPKKITYNHVNDSSLVAEISGTVNGELHAEQFPMWRKK